MQLVRFARIYHFWYLQTWNMTVRDPSITCTGVGGFQCDCRYGRILIKIIKICHAICTYQAAKHSQPPKYLAQYSITAKGCKWLGTTSNSEPQMALHQDMSSHLHLPCCQTFTTSKIPDPIQHDNQRLSMAWHHIKLRAANGLASRYAKPSAPTRLPNIHNLQILGYAWANWSNFSWNKMARTLRILPPQILVNNTYYFNRINTTFQYPAI